MGPYITRIWMMPPLHRLGSLESGVWTSLVRIGSTIRVIVIRMVVNSLGNPANILRVPFFSAVWLFDSWISLGRIRMRSQIKMPIQSFYYCHSRTG